VIGRTPEEKIAAIYSTLTQAWGPQHWWPAHSRFEVIVGAFLTQNTSWTNVEIALNKLRKSRALNLKAMRRLPQSTLEELIRSSGYFRQKANRLKNFIHFLDQEYGVSLTRMFRQPTDVLRKQLLALEGVGPETADSILLYAGQHAVFVVDAYTKRIATRHGILAESTPYEEVRDLFERALSGKRLPKESDKSDTASGAWHPPSRMSRAVRSPQAQVYNEMHGLLVGVAKNYCLKSGARCEQCPLLSLLILDGRC
jgi:endonuclease-3 related protein